MENKKNKKNFKVEVKAHLDLVKTVAPPPPFLFIATLHTVR